MVRRLIIMALALLLALPASLFAAQVTAVPDRDRLGAGESLQLELQVNGSPDEDPDLGVLDRDWEILSRSKSSQMQLVNGNFSRSLILTLNLMPKRSGELEIPAVCFGADCSRPLTVSVTEQATTKGTADPLLIEAEAQPWQVPVGAQVLFTVRVLHRVDLAQASLSEPRVEGGGAEIRQLGKDRAVETRRGGYRYQGIERRYTIFPHQAGQLIITALQLDAQIEAGPSGRDPFSRSLQQVRRKTEALPIQVSAAPADLGSRPWLPARRLILQDDWQQQPPTLRVGEPATRTLTLTAEGLPAANLPELQLPVPKGCKSYPDQPSRQDAETTAGIVGTLQQKLALVPTRPGPLELPAVDLDWYDVAAGQWSHLHLDPLKLEVAPAAPGSAQAPLPTPVVEAPPLPAATVETPPPSAFVSPSPVAPSFGAASSGFWPWLSLALGLGWILTLLLLWRSKRGSTRTQENPTAVNERVLTEQAAFKAVLAAAGRNHPQSTRQALRRWSRQRFPHAPGREIEALCLLGGAPLTEALAALDNALYGQSPSLWEGVTLIAALKQLPRQQKPVKEPLQPLYPAD